MDIERGILGISKALFWDVDPQTIDPQKHAAYIVERILTRGNWDEFKILIAHYGKSKIKKIVKDLRYLDKRDLNFCSIYFRIPISQFRSYATKQLNQTNWNY